MNRNMSAIVCGKRSIFEDLPTTPQVSKRIRCSSSSSSSSPLSSSPVRVSYPRSFFAAASVSSNHHFFASEPQSSLIMEHLRALFPEMDDKLLESALEKCGDDLDSAIRSLNELRLGSSNRNVDLAEGTLDVSEQNVPVQSQGVVTTNEEIAVVKEIVPKDGADWVEFFVREMMSAFNMDDAKARTSRVLEVLEKSIFARASVEAAQSFNQENMMLKEQVQALIQENTILKRAVSIQYERQKDYENTTQEIQHLKQLVAPYQEQLKALEVNNYALTLHLKQAQQSNSIPGRFHPDVF